MMEEKSPHPVKLALPYLIYAAWAGVMLYFHVTEGQYLFESSIYTASKDEVYMPPRILILIQQTLWLLYALPALFFSLALLARPIKWLREGYVIALIGVAMSLYYAAYTFSILVPMGLFIIPGR